MLRYRLFCLLLLSAITGLLSFRPEDEYFEGEIEYKCNVETGNKNKQAFLQRIYGDHAIWYLKKGNYKDIYNGAYMGADYLDVDKGFYYFRATGSDTLERTDTKVRDDSAVSIKFKKAAKRVAGYYCDEMIVRFKSLTGGKRKEYTYYYAPELKIDPEWFKKVKMGSKDMIYAAIRSAPLMYYMKDGGVTTIITATRVVKRHILDTEVQVPSDAIIKDSH